MNRRQLLGIAGLLAALGLDLWLRGHTFGPSIRDRLGFAPYLATSPESEPLDCDEAVYAYMGRRVVGGAALYRDVTDNKPPLGYWVHAAAADLGGPTEWTVRTLALPFVLATVGLVWWLGLRLGGAGTATVAALAYAVLSTDPYIYGNSSNLEFMSNALGTGSLALFLSAWNAPGRAFGRFAAAGAAVGLAALVKQVAATHLVVFGLALLIRGISGAAGRAVEDRRRSAGWDVGAMAALGAGFALPLALALLVLARQGALEDAYEDVIRYGAALATDTPAPPHAPPFLVRWVTGNADPEGRLPWPFGSTDYLVWWGRGAWPVWLAAIPCLVGLAARRSAPAASRLVAAWTLSAWVQVVLPGLFWPHYYLLPLPGVALALAVAFSDLTAGEARGRRYRFARGLGAVALTACLLGTAVIQVRDYLLVPPEALTRYNGGPQWNADRAIGRELARRTAGWDRPRLFVWGWQSPLYFYSGLDGASRQSFADDLIRAFAGSNHPLIRPRIERIMAELEERPPALVFCGYPPFPALKAFLDRGYLPSQTFRGLWVETGRYGRFEASGPTGAAVGRVAPSTTR